MPEGMRRTAPHYSRRLLLQPSMRKSELIAVFFLCARIIQRALDLASAVATHLTAGGLAAQSVNILFQVCFIPSRLRAPVSLGVSAVSLRTPVNNAGLQPEIERLLASFVMVGAGQDAEKVALLSSTNDPRTVS